MSHKEHYRTVEKRKALLGQCWKMGEHSGRFKYIVQVSQVESREAIQGRSENVREGRAQGTSQARLGRGGVKAREDCTSGEALRLTVTQTIWSVALERPGRFMHTLRAMIATAEGYQVAKTVCILGLLINRSMPLFSSATTPLPPALSPLPSHAPCPLKLCPYYLAAD